MKFLLVYILLGYVAVFVKSHNEFTPEGCLLVHNELRALHKDTLSVEYDAELEKSAEQSANFVKATGGGEDTRPTRVLPKRRRRHVEDIDKNVHIESWDGDIYYPDTSFTPQGTGESIHKMCCRTAPHCPREFFHGLLFPPSAEGVVRDFYNEEMKSYDFASGKKKAQFYTQIKHFTNIVWKKTSKIGCFQTKMDSNNCVYTVIHYKEKGSEGTPEIFKENVGVLLASEEDSTNIVLIFLIVFFIVLFLVLVILCYCCRDRLSEKYYEIKIKTDTMKAEQELETDSTAFWWLKIFKKKRRTVKRPTRARSTKTHQSLRDRNISIEVVHTVKPQRSIKQPHRARGQSNALKYKGISQKATHYQPDETIYENTQNILPPPPYTPYAPTPQHQYRNEVDDEDIYDAPESTGSFHPSRPQSAHQQHPQMKREPSFSGKPPPPPVPTPQPRPTQPMVPPQTRPSQPMMPPQAKQPNKPQVTSRPTSAASRPTKPIAPPPSAPTAAPRPMGRPNTAPKPTESFNEGQDSPSVNELRNKFNQQNVANKPAPAVKTKPMMPPPAYRPR